MYIRKTQDEFYVLGNYGFGYEVVDTCMTRKEVKDSIKTYRENQPGVAFKTKSKRVKI
jgi:hypothetical protein